jgi:hypothetical protein
MKKLLTFGYHLHILGLRIAEALPQRFPRPGGKMESRTSYPRASISLVLAITLATVFTIRSFAAPEASKSTAERSTQDCTGALTVKAGQVSINGNPAQTGTTVMSGSVISTGSNGKAIIDLGALGRVEVGDNTTITLTCVAGLLEVRSNCSRTEVEVKRGAVDVRAPKAEALTAGKKAKYDGAVDFTSTGGVDVKVECEGNKAGGGIYVGPGLVGFLALIGVGGAIAGGIAASNNEGAGAPSSPIR